MHTILICVAEAWAQKLKSLAQHPKWTGRTPSSAQDDHVSTAVLRFLHSSGHDGWGKVDDMWQAKCMPLWGLVRRQEIGFKPCFVVKVYSYCFITWPAVEIAPKMWMPDMDVKRLDTSFAMGLDEWEAALNRAVSAAASGSSGVVPEHVAVSVLEQQFPDAPALPERPMR